MRNIGIWPLFQMNWIINCKRRAKKGATNKIRSHKYMQLCYFKIVPILFIHVQIKFIYAKWKYAKPVLNNLYLCYTSVRLAAEQFLWIKQQLKQYLKNISVTGILVTVTHWIVISLGNSSSRIPLLYHGVSLLPLYPVFN